jgi:drug/metabolite transporter (DMT)-like permease
MAAYAAVIVASVLWGSLHPASKPAVEAVGAVQVVFVRALLACITLGAIVLIRSRPREIAAQLRGRMRGVLATSMLSFTISSVLAMLALGYLPASVNGILNNTHPLWLALGTAMFFPPRRPVLLIGGSAIALLGVILVFFPDLSLSSVEGEHALSGLGIALSLAGSGVIAWSNVVGRQVMRRGDPIVIAAVASGLAVPVLAALSFASGGFGPLLASSLTVKLLLVYVGIGCTATNFALWFYGLQHLPAAQASAFQYLIPPLGVVFSAMFLGEPITEGLVLGGSLILVGLILTQASARSATRKSTPTAVTAPPLIQESGG